MIKHINFYKLFIFTFLILISFNLNGQCGLKYGLDQYTVLTNSSNIAVVAEVSGLSANTHTGELVVISDKLGAVDWSNNHTCNSNFNDVEAISYISSIAGTHTFAVAHERYRVISFIQYTEGAKSISYSPKSYISISGLSSIDCGGKDNNGIEGLAFDPNSNSLYFATEFSSQSIYKINLPNTINGQNIAAEEIADLQSISGLFTYSTHALDVLPNGNIVLLVTKPNGASDNGLFPRQMIEMDQCGNMLSQQFLEPTLTNSAELEGIVSVDNDIYVTGEYGVLYQLQKQEAPSSINVTSPTVGEVFTSASTTDVKWTSTQLSGNVQIELYKGQTLIKNLSANTPNDGSESITFPQVQSTANNYYVVVSSLSNRRIISASGAITLAAAEGSISIVNSNSGQSYNIGSTLPVYWTSSNVQGDVDITLYKGTEMVSTLASSTANDGIQSSKIPSTTDGSNYKVKVASCTNPSVFDMGSSFSIINPDYTVTYPKVGHSFLSGADLDVQWTSTASGQLTIELYKGQELVNVLSASTDDDGFERVSLPTISSSDVTYRIKVKNIEDPNISSLSGYFNIIVTNFVKITSPSLGDVFAPGSSTELQWTSNVYGDVNIELYKGNQLITTIAKQTPGDYNETINFPIELEEGDDYKFKLTSLANSHINDFSDFFSIKNSKFITITNPVSGSIITAGNSLNIQWSDNINENVNIELFEGNKVLAKLASDIPSDNSEQVIIPRELTGGNNCMVRITSTVDPKVNDQSGAFTILPIENSDTDGGDDTYLGECILLNENGYNQSFESGLDGWKQSEQDGMDWTSAQSGTPSYGTGPYGASAGKMYYYTEASGGNKSKKAVLISPCFDLLNISSLVLNLDYHMYGASTGSIMLDIIEANSGASKTIFTQAGNQGNQWNNISLNLSSFTGKQVYFQITATVGYSYRSDMAIDNFQLNSSNSCELSGEVCDDGDACTEGEVYDQNCNCTGGKIIDADGDGFCASEDIDDNDACVPQAGNECSTCKDLVKGSLVSGFNSGMSMWTQSSDDNSDWIRSSEATPSSRTGPSSSVEGSHYLYIESSGTGYPYKSAILTSPCIDLSTLSAPVLSFAYHMYGASTGSIQAYIYNTSSGKTTEIFNESGEKGDEWLKAELSLGEFAGSTIQVIIKGTTGISYRSDLGIDDIRVESGSKGIVKAELRSNELTVASHDWRIGIESITHLEAFPNPAITDSQIQFESTVSGIGQIVISNQIGQHIYMEDINIEPKLNSFKIKTHSLKPGVYIISVIHKASTNSLRLQVIN